MTTRSALRTARSGKLGPVTRGDPLWSFRTMLASKPAIEQPWGESLVRRFRDLERRLLILDDDETVRNHADAVRGSALQVLYAPSTGWITPAEHGILFDRPGERYLHPILGCRSSCTYCYLRGMSVGLRPLRLHVGVDDLLRTLEQDIRIHRPDGGLIYCSGEFADSLSDADLFPVGAILAEYFGEQYAGRRDVRLELRTKSDQVGALLKVEHRGQTTVAFSITPPEHIATYEINTCSFQDRIEAAGRCGDAGYPVAFKMEPVILSANWQTWYAAAFQQIAIRMDPSRIHHVSIGCLRWSEALAEAPPFAQLYAEEIRRSTSIEYRPGVFNSTRPREERVAAYDWMRKTLRENGMTAPIVWALEEPSLIAELNDESC